MTTNSRELSATPIGNRLADLLPWPAALSIALVALAAAIGFAPLWVWLHNAWTNKYGVYSHGYPVAVMAVWLAMRYWQVAPPRTIRPDWLGLAAVLGTMGALWAMQFVGIDISRIVLLPAILLAAVAYVLGRNAAIRLLLPAAFFSFAVLPWWLLSKPLQWLTTGVAERAVRASGISAHVDSHFVYIPSGIFQIAESCSGLSYFVSALALTTFYGLMYFHNWRRRALLVVIGCSAALASNWLRVYSLIVIGHVSEMQHPLVLDHYLYGWVIFVVVFAPVLWLARTLEMREQMHTEAPARTSSQSSSPLVDAPARVLGAAVVAVLLLLSARMYGAAPILESADDILPDQTVSADLP